MSSKSTTTSSEYETESESESEEISSSPSNSSSSSSSSIIYIDEDVPEIEYYELVSMEELVKANPNFIAFSKEEIYNDIFNFVKNKFKTENFVKLFYEIINRNKPNINNFIIVTDADRGKFEEEDIAAFIANLKKNDKIADINLALKSKNKLWFPLNYSVEGKLTFEATQKTVIEMSEDNKYIIFKDDERNIPVLGLYLFSPVTILEDYLNDKITAHTHKPIKHETLSAVDYDDFDKLLNDYKIKLPLDKIDNNNYDYTSLNLLLQKYNYNLDNISQSDLNEIRTYLTNLNKSEGKYEKIVYKKPVIERVVINNPRYSFFNIMKEIGSLVDLTIKSVDTITQLLKTNSKTATKTIELSLFSIINNINDKNYNDIIKNLRELRININIDNIARTLTNFKDNNTKKKITQQLEELEIRFELLKYSFTDIYKLNFNCNDDEHEFSIGTDESKYEGNPTKMTNQLTSKEDKEPEEIEEEPEEVDIITDELKLNKYYTNSLYNTEPGFAELLKVVLPFVYRMRYLSGLPLNYDLLASYLFNKFRTFEPKATIIRKYIPTIDDEELQLYVKQQVKFLLLQETVAPKVLTAINEYFMNYMDVIYDIISYWSIKIQRAIVDNTLFLDYSKMSSICDDLWEEYGAPYNMTSKNGVLPYLLCIFDEVYNDLYKSETSDRLDPGVDYKKVIIDKINGTSEIETIRKIKNSKPKTNQGIKYYDTLYELLSKKDYKNDGFLRAYINALIYMPSIKFKKIHKYLQGCCLEKIDENFTADLYLQTDRNDLQKAKEKLKGERVFNMPRYKRFYIKKITPKEKSKKFQKISNPIKYELQSVPLNDWLTNLKDLKKNKTVFTKELLNGLLMSVVTTSENYKDLYLSYFNNKDLKQLFYNYNFNNYKQIGKAVSKILYKHLKDMDYVNIINNTIAELDKLNSIVDNSTDIINIRRIAIIRILSLPAVPENAKNKKLVPSIEMPNYQEIMKEIITTVINIMNNSHMLNLEEQIDFINKIREQNKFDILARMNKKSREEKDIEKELKKYGLQYKEDEDFNNEVNDNPIEAEIEGENEFSLDNEDAMDDDERMEYSNYGFIYAD